MMSSVIHKDYIFAELLVRRWRPLPKSDHGQHEVQE